MLHSIHLTIHIPHRRNRYEHCDNQYDIRNDLVSSRFFTRPTLFEDDTDVDRDELLGEGKKGGERED